ATHLPQPRSPRTVYPERPPRRRGGRRSFFAGVRAGHCPQTGPAAHQRHGGAGRRRPGSHHLPRRGPGPGSNPAAGRRGVGKARRRGPHRAGQGAIHPAGRTAGAQLHAAHERHCHPHPPLYRAHCPHQGQTARHAQDHAQLPDDGKVGRRHRRGHQPPVRALRHDHSQGQPRGLRRRHHAGHPGHPRLPAPHEQGPQDRGRNAQPRRGGRGAGGGRRVPDHAGQYDARPHARGRSPHPRQVLHRSLRRHHRGHHRGRGRNRRGLHLRRRPYAFDQKPRHQPEGVL
ncbi:MAG: Quinolinate phosphoribosyltransferase [decarboxylating], partial [uncultured Cytophagales bacterium]